VSPKPEAAKNPPSAQPGQKVLIPEKEKPERPPLEQSPDFGWYLLGWVGLVFALVGGTDLLLTWYPLNVGNPEWEFGTVSATLDGLPVPALGFALLLGAGVAGGKRWLVRTMAVVLVLLAAVIVLAAVLYATNVPIALQSVTDPLIRTGLKKAIAKTTTQAVLYPIAFVWIAVKAWRHSGKS
jgi:hypothetical protein